MHSRMHSRMHACMHACIRIESLRARMHVGAFVTGCVLDGARWDVQGGCLAESKPKELFFPMPVIHCKVANNAQ